MQVVDGFARLATTTIAALLLLGGCTPGGQKAAAGPTSPTGGTDQAMQTELQRASERAAMCSTREAFAAGLRAEYFERPGFEGAVRVARLEGPLDQAWPAAEAGSAVPRSARWLGWVKPAMAGRYVFHSAEPTAQITVAGQRFGAGADPAAAVDLATGRYYPIRIEWPDRAATSTQADLRLSWTAPHGARYLVPRAALFPPSDTVAVASPAR